MWHQLQGHGVGEGAWGLRGAGQEVGAGICSYMPRAQAWKTH